MMRRFSPVLLLLAIATVASGPSSALAETTIKVLVNDEPITNYDIAQRVKLMQLTREKGGVKEATDALIDETLELQEAKKRGFVVPDKEIDRIFATIAEKNAKMTASQFTQALGQSGLSAATLKRRIRSQVTWVQLVQGKAKATTVVKSKDITAAMFAKNDASSMKVTEYILQQIIFIVPDNKKSPAYVAQRRREAEAFRGRFTGCDKSIDLAKSLKDVVVVPLGRRDTTQLNGQQADDIKGTAVGKTIAPNETPRGVELIAICDAHEVNSDAAVRAEAESKLILDQAKDVGVDYLKQLRKAAIIVYR